MKRSFSLFISLTKNWLRSKSGVFFSIMFPIMLLLIFSTIFGGPAAAEYTLHVEDEDVLFEMELSDYEASLTEGEEIDEQLRERFLDEDYDISENATMEKNDEDWYISDGEERLYHLKVIEGEDLIEVYGLSRVFIEALDATENLNIEEVANLTEYREKNGEFEERRGLRIGEGFHENALNKSMALRMAVMQDTMVRIYGRFDMDDDDRANFTEGWETLNRTSENISAQYANITLYTSPGDQAAPIVRGNVLGVMDTFNSRMVGMEDSTVQLSEEEVSEDRGLDAVDYYLPGFIAAFIMSNGIIGVTSNISEFKRNGTLKRLTATPLKKRDWILANVGQQTVLAFGLTAVMILVAVLVFGAQAYPDLYAIGLIFLGAVAFCSVGIVLGGLIKDVEAASGAGNAIAFPMMFLSGAFIPIETMPDYLQTIARFLPLYYFHQGLREIMILQNPSDALLAYIVIGIFGLFFIILAIKTTRWKDI